MTGGLHTVRDVMTVEVVSVGRDTPFSEIVRIQQQSNVSAVPVVHGDGEVVGVVSEADLLPKEEFRDVVPNRLTEMHRLDDVCGIVSRGDLLKVFLREDEDIAEEVRREIVAYLFPGEPPTVRVDVSDGTVTLSGPVRDTARLPVAVRLARSVEGVVDVRLDIDQPATR